MTGLAGDLEPPGHAAPPRDRRVLPVRVPDTGLEIEGDVAPARGFQELPARGLHRVARVLLVAHEGHDDSGAGERTRRVQGAERLQHHDVAALHVGHAGPVRGVPLPLEPLEGALRLEHGIQVPDQQQALPLFARVFGEQVARPAHGGPVDPPGRKAEDVQLAAEDIPHPPHAGEVQRTAVLVDDALEQLDGLIDMGVYPRRDTALLRPQVHGLTPIRSWRVAWSSRRTPRD